MEEPVRKIIALINAEVHSTKIKKGKVYTCENNGDFGNLSNSFICKNPEIFSPCSQDGETLKELIENQNNKGVAYQHWSDGWYSYVWGFTFKEPHLYRREPEQEYRHYTAEDMDKMDKLRFKRKDSKNGERYSFEDYDKDGLSYYDKGYGEWETITYEYLYENYLNLDDSPCGVLVEN